MGNQPHRLADQLGQSARLRKANTSGYQGVSWHKGAKKWSAVIWAGGKHHYLGLFKSAEEAHLAYIRTAAQLREGKTAPTRQDLLDTVKGLYEAHGIRALFTPFLEKQKSALYPRLLAAGLNQSVLLGALGLTEEYAAWRTSARTYRGVTKPRWSYEVALAKAQEIKELHGDLPTVEWFRKNGYSSLTTAVHASGHTWEDVRKAVGCFATSNFCPSRNGMRWRSRPEACLSDFLYARGIVHKRGERYPDEYSEQSGRRWGSYDLHFPSLSGASIDVEIWGDPLNSLSGGRYQKTRAFKEAFHAKNPDFLGIPYKDCLSDARLTEILKPYLGVVEPFQFDKPSPPYSRRERL